MPQTKNKKMEFENKRKFDIETINKVEKKLYQARSWKLRSKDILLPKKFKLTSMPTPAFLNEKYQNPSEGSFHISEHTIIPYRKEILGCSNKTLIYKLVIGTDWLIKNAPNNKQSDNNEFHLVFHNYNFNFSKEWLFVYAFRKLENWDKDYRIPNIQIIKKQQKPIFRLFNSMNLDPNSGEVIIGNFILSLKWETIQIPANRLLWVF